MDSPETGAIDGSALGTELEAHPARIAGVAIAPISFQNTRLAPTPLLDGGARRGCG